MNRDLESKVERKIRLWILEQEYERQRESQRRSAAPGGTREGQK
jgi:hypothetical protein